MGQGLKYWFDLNDDNKISLKEKLLGSLILIGTISILMWFWVAFIVIMKMVVGAK
jgi:hypothetical protein